MKKYFSYILILIVLVGVGLFSPTSSIYAQVPPGGCPAGTTQQINPQNGQPFCLSTTNAGQAQGSGPRCGVTNPWQCFIDMALLIPGYAAIGIFKLASFLTYLSGAIMNFVIRYSLVDMTRFISGATVVNTAWSTVRDIANMGFIFILLYAAIQTILGIGSDTKKLIVNVIIVAILINFSLFFTKIVIDISNILAILFYDAIAPGALTNANTGLSYHFMQPLDLQSIFNTANSGLAGGRLFTIGVMGTILALIVAFVFFAVSIMFVIRLVVLIFVLILSPIAFMAFVLPALKTHADKWKDALIGQAFFAPIYFMLTWIVIVVAQGLLGATGGDLATAISGQIQPDGTILPPTATNIGILVNFIIVIVMLIASLIIAKDWANKAPGGVSKLTSWAMGAAGGASFGLAGRFGRNTVGRAAQAVQNTQAYRNLQLTAQHGGMIKSRMARATLWTQNKASTGSFDPRAATDLGAVLSTMGAGGPSGTGGYSAKKAQQTAQTQARATAARSATTINTVHSAMAPGGVGPSTARVAIRRLSIQDLENLPFAYLTDPNFVAQLNAKQADAINDSQNFTAAQKTAFTTARQAPLINAIAATDVNAAQITMTRFSAKELAKISVAHLTDITTMDAYTPSILRRMGTELDPGDITTTRAAILAANPAGHPAVTWLNSADGIANFS